MSLVYRHDWHTYNPYGAQGVRETLETLSEPLITEYICLDLGVNIKGEYLEVRRKRNENKNNKTNRRRIPSR